MAKTEFITFGPVHLDIRDRKRSVTFWRDLVGLQLLDATGDSAALGVDENNPLIVLHPSATRPVQRGYRGLYHLSINVPSEAELARVLGRVLATGHPYGASDHIVARSIYLTDPDGIGLEITFETPERVRSYRWDEGKDRPLVIDSDGRRRSGVEPLATGEVLAALPDRDILRPLPAGTIVGHLHLQVQNLEASYFFYRDKIGLIHNLFAPWSGYGDLGAGGRVAHRIALNTWHGVHATARPSGFAGLRSFTMRFLSYEHLSRAAAGIGSVEVRGREHVAHDPDGNTLIMIPAPSNGVGNTRATTEIMGQRRSS